MSARSRSQGSRNVNAPPRSMAAPVPKVAPKRTAMKPLDDLTPGERERFQESKRRQDLEMQAAEGGISPYVVRPVGPANTNAADSVLAGVLAMGPRDDMTGVNMDMIRASVSEADNAVYDFVQRVARTAGVSMSDARLTAQRGPEALLEAINAKGLVHYRHPVLHLGSVNDRAMNHNASLVEQGQRPVDSADYTLQSQMLRVPVYHPPLGGGNGGGGGAGRGRPGGGGAGGPGGAPGPTLEPPAANTTTGATPIPLPDQGLIATQLIGMPQGGGVPASSSGPPGVPGSILMSNGGGTPAPASSATGLPGSVGRGSVSSGLPGSVSAGSQSLISRGPRAQSVLDEINDFEEGRASDTVSFEMFRQRANEIERDAGIAARQAFEDAVASDPSNSFAAIFVEEGGQQARRDEARPASAHPTFSLPDGIGSKSTPLIQAEINARRAAGEPEPVRSTLASPTTNIQVPGPNGEMVTYWDAANMTTNLLRIAFMPGAGQANVDALMAAANGGRLPGLGNANPEERSRQLAGKLDELMQFVDSLRVTQTPTPRHNELPENITLLFISHEMTQAIMFCYGEFRGDASTIPGAQPIEMRARVPLVDLMTHRDVTADFADAVAYKLMFTRGLRGSGRQQEFTLRTLQINYRNTMMRLVQAHYSFTRFLGYSAGAISQLTQPSLSTIEIDRGRYNNGPAGAYTDRPTMMYGQPSYPAAALLPGPAPSQHFYGAAQTILANTPPNPNGGFSGDQLRQIEALAASARRLQGRN